MKINWTDPVTNTDGSPVIPGQITGYVVGIRTSGPVGTYPTEYSAATLARANDIITALAEVLSPGTYYAAVSAVGAVTSGWSAEAEFTIIPPPPPVIIVPNPPTGLTVT